MLGIGLKVLLRDFQCDSSMEELEFQALKIKITTSILTYRTVFSFTKNVRLGSSNEGVELTIGQNVLG